MSARMEGCARTRRRRRAHALPRRKTVRWSSAEVDGLLEGVREHGVGKWAAILRSSAAFNTVRTSVDLKDKWRNLAAHIRALALGVADPPSSADITPPRSAPPPAAEPPVFAAKQMQQHHHHHHHHHDPYIKPEPINFPIAPQPMGTQHLSAHPPLAPLAPGPPPFSSAPPPRSFAPTQPLRQLAPLAPLPSSPPKYATHVSLAQGSLPLVSPRPMHFADAAGGLDEVGVGMGPPAELDYFASADFRASAPLDALPAMRVDAVHHPHHVVSHAHAHALRVQSVNGGVPNSAPHEALNFDDSVIHAQLAAPHEPFQVSELE